MSTTAREKPPDGRRQSREGSKLHAPLVDRPSSFSSKCAVCNHPERVPLKRFVQCPGCKHRYHLSCHNPPLRQIPDLSEWVCSRCLKLSTMDRAGCSKSSNGYPFVQKVCARCPRLMNTFEATLCLMCSNTERAQKSRSKHAEKMKLSSIAAPIKTSSHFEPSSRQCSYSRPTMSTKSKDVLTEPKGKRKHNLISKYPPKFAERDNLCSSSLLSSRDYTLGFKDIGVNVTERKNPDSRESRNFSQPTRQHNDAPVLKYSIENELSIGVPLSKLKPIQESRILNIGNIEPNQRDEPRELLLQFETLNNTASAHRDEPHKLKSHIANDNTNLEAKITSTIIDSSDRYDEDDGRDLRKQLMATRLETETPMHSSSPNITDTTSFSGSSISSPRRCSSESEDNLELSTCNQMDLAPNKHRLPQVSNKGLWVKTLDLEGTDNAVNRESSDDMMATENESLIGQAIKLERASSPAFPKEREDTKSPSIYNDASAMDNEALFSRMIKLETNPSPRISAEKEITRSPVIDNEDNVFYGISNMADDDASDEIMLLKYKILSDQGLQLRSDYLSESSKSEFRTSQERIPEIEAKNPQKAVHGHTCTASRLQNLGDGSDKIGSATFFPGDESCQLMSLFSDNSIPQDPYDVTRIDKFLYSEAEATCNQNQEWLEQKKHEIAARPHRKFLFGRIKKPRISRIKENADINEEWTPLKNLFGLPEKLEPILFNGQLAMAEPRKPNSRGIVPRLSANKVWVV